MNRLRLIVAGLALTLLAGCGEQAQFRSTDITGASFARGFQLTAHDGKPRTLADFRGKVVVMFFGFTHCPDVCPSALAQFAGAMNALEQDAERVQVLFVTVDPERDSAAVLSKYVPAFHPGFLGLYGDAPALAATAKEYKVVYEKREGKTAASYTMDHTAGVYIYDPKGNVRLFSRHDQSVDDLVHDIRLLLAG